MLDLVPCAHCGCHILDDASYLRPNAIDDLPPGWRPAPHLCDLCVRELQAKRHAFWGYIYKIPCQDFPRSLPVRR